MRSIFNTACATLSLLPMRLAFASCSKPPVELSPTLGYAFPKQMDADTIGDLGWYMITSGNLDKNEVMAFDQRAGGAL